MGAQLVMSCSKTVHQVFTHHSSRGGLTPATFTPLCRPLFRRQRTEHCQPLQRPLSAGLARWCRLSCSCNANSPHFAPSDKTDAKSRTFLQFLQQQAVVAAGTLLMLMLLIRPIASRWHQMHQPVVQSAPSAVWLPRSVTDQLVAQRQPNLPSTMFAAVSSSIPATSSRLLHISDAILMQLTVTLQQVTHLWYTCMRACALADSVDSCISAATTTLF